MRAIKIIPAGAELDTLVAEKVMGEPEWSPSTSIIDAWSLIEALRPDDQLKEHQPCVQCELSRGYSSERFVEDADTMPLAVCRAALAAKDIFEA